jgi:trehalose 6-phosphate phosphatase
MSLWRAHLVHRVHAASRCVLFLDFDGTVARRVRNPMKARLAPDMRRVLAELSRSRKARLYFISGRRRDDLLKRVRLDGCAYLGLFGAEHGARVRIRRSPVMRRIKAEVEKRIDGLPRVWVEDKGPAFVLHYLNAPDAARRDARRRLKAVLNATRGARCFASAHGLEVVPRDFLGKGAAVRTLLRRPVLRGAFAIYIGDDLSDEPAFRAVRPGIGIRVGVGRRTSAQHAVRNPEAVRALLQRVAEALR